MWSPTEADIDIQVSKGSRSVDGSKGRRVRRDNTDDVITRIAWSAAEPLVRAAAAAAGDDDDDDHQPGVSHAYDRHICSVLSLFLYLFFLSLRLLSQFM